MAEGAGPATCPVCLRERAARGPGAAKGECIGAERGVSVDCYRLGYERERAAREALAKGVGAAPEPAALEWLPGPAARRQVALLDTSVLLAIDPHDGFWVIELRLTIRGDEPAAKVTAARAAGALRAAGLLGPVAGGEP